MFSHEALVEIIDRTCFFGRLQIILKRKVSDVGKKVGGSAEARREAVKGWQVGKRSFVGGGGWFGCCSFEDLKCLLWNW
jgi:hypothetical protein